MSTIHRCRPAVFVVVAVLTFAVSAPIAVNADDQVITEEQILAVQEHDPVLAPAIPSWDESSGSAAVERTRAEMSASLSGELISGQEQAAALTAAATSWDETSGYGAVEANRAAASALLASDVGSAWLAASRAAAARRAVPAFPEWDAERWSPVELGQAMSPDDIPAALASGQRAESAHLATVPLPGEDAVEVRRTQR